MLCFFTFAKYIGSVIGFYFFLFCEILKLSIVELWVKCDRFAEKYECEMKKVATIEH
jgi:hypothetical protein